MKKLIALLLLSTFFLQTFYVAGVTIWFYANRAYISKQLCVNKSRPELKCNGKCYLGRKLKEAEQKENQQAPLQEKQVKETEPCIIELLSYCIAAPTADIIRHPAPAHHFTSSYLSAVFRPPSSLMS